MQHKGDASLSWPRRIALGCIVLIGLGTIVGSGDPPEPPPPPAPETRTINISSYGQGDVADSTTTIPCDSHNCSKEYTLNSKQVLTAKPRAGWTFERWTGCDSVSEAQCTVAMNKDRYVMPVFLRAVTTTLHADVVTLGDADMAAIVKNEAGVLTISRSSPSVANVSVRRRPS